MKSEINAIIEKNLPAEVGNTLKKVLEQGQKDAKAVKELQVIVTGKTEVIASKSGEIATLNALITKAGDITKREQEVLKKELWHANTMLTLQLGEANKRAELISGYTTSLLRNTTIRKAIFDSENQAGYSDGNGNWVYPSPVNKSLTETKKEE
jgi:hypothetical protein